MGTPWESKSEECAEAGFGSFSMMTATLPEDGVVITSQRSTPHPTPGGRQRSHDDLRANDDITTDSQCPTRVATASVRSMSSTENSRRDSAISSSSQRARRPKTARSTSKRSVRTVAGDELSKTLSQSSRQRPRHQRFASSGSIHLPPTNIEEALALHARSCELFSSASSRPSTSHNSTPSPYNPYTHPSLCRSLSSTEGFPVSNYSPNSAPSYQTHAEPPSPEEDDYDQYYTSSFPPTVMHWTSEETRLREYEAFDRANTGMRGLLKKLLPKCVKKGQTKFYDEKDGSDAGSVRRIRLDFPAEKDEPRTIRLPRPLGI